MVKNYKAHKIIFFFVPLLLSGALFIINYLLIEKLSTQYILYCVSLICFALIPPLLLMVAYNLEYYKINYQYARIRVRQVNLNATMAQQALCEMQLIPLGRDAAKKTNTLRILQNQRRKDELSKQHNISNLKFVEKNECVHASLSDPAQFSEAMKYYRNFNAKTLKYKFQYFTSSSFLPQNYFRAVIAFLILGSAFFLVIHELEIKTNIIVLITLTISFYIGTSEFGSQAQYSDCILIDPNSNLKEEFYKVFSSKFLIVLTLIGELLLLLFTLVQISYDELSYELILNELLSLFTFIIAVALGNKFLSRPPSDQIPTEELGKVKIMVGLRTFVGYLSLFLIILYFSTAINYTTIELATPANQMIKKNFETYYMLINLGLAVYFGTSKK